LVRSYFKKTIPSWDKSGRVDVEGANATLRILKEVDELQPQGRSMVRCQVSAQVSGRVFDANQPPLNAAVVGSEQSASNRVEDMWNEKELERLKAIKERSGSKAAPDIAACRLRRHAG
jgi:hypothetical protein